MRKWQIDAFDLGSLALVEVPMPTLDTGEVLVKVKAVSLNYRDLLLTGNRSPWQPPLPFTPCSDLSGTIEAVGPGVSRWKPGDRVVSTFVGGWIDGTAPAEAVLLGGPGPGALATHAVLDQQWLVSAPASLSDEEASTLPCAALTAWFGLVEHGHVKAGDTVLIHGTGGVALFGLLFARMHGAQVIVVSQSLDKRKAVLSLGASHALSRDADWPAEVKRLTGGRGVEHVLETVGGSNLGRSLSVVSQSGRVSMIGVIAGGGLEASAGDFIRNRAVVQGLSVGHRRGLEDMIRAIDANKVRPVIADTYDFAAVPEAFQHLERGAFGKVVVTLAD